MNSSQKIQKIQQVLRKLKVLPIVEMFRYFLSVSKYHFKNKTFIANNPHFRLPPQFLAYDAYSAPDWNFYKKSGEETSFFLAKTADKYLPKDLLPTILEWGCGPGRVIRHIPQAFSVSAKVYGSDYNQASIVWCNENIPSVNFELNELTPPLAHHDKFFDFIYSISVFTHLSEEVSLQWISELYRIAKPGAILIITTNGDSREKFMLPDELEVYRKEGLLIRGNVEEGKKMFWACHSPSYGLEVLFKNFEVLEHLPGTFPYTAQDYWVLRR